MNILAAEMWEVAEKMTQTEGEELVENKTPCLIFRRNSATDVDLKVALLRIDEKDAGFFWDVPEDQQYEIDEFPLFIPIYCPT